MEIQTNKQTNTGHANCNTTTAPQKYIVQSIIENNQQLTCGRCLLSNTDTVVELLLLIIELPLLGCLCLQLTPEADTVAALGCAGVKAHGATLVSLELHDTTIGYTDRSQTGQAESPFPETN